MAELDLRPIYSRAKIHSSLRRVRGQWSRSSGILSVRTLECCSSCHTNFSSSPTTIFLTLISEVTIRRIFKPKKKLLCQVELGPAREGDNV